MLRRITAGVFLVWMLWQVDPRIGIRTTGFSTHKECENAVNRINQEHVRTRPHGYVGGPAFCYWSEPPKPPNFDA